MVCRLIGGSNLTAHIEHVVADGQRGRDSLARVVGRKGLNVACRVHKAMAAMVVMEVGGTACWRSTGPTWCGLFGSLGVCRLKSQRVLRLSAMCPVKFPRRARSAFIA